MILGEVSFRVWTLSAYVTTYKLMERVYLSLARALSLVVGAEQAASPAVAALHPWAKQLDKGIWITWGVWPLLCQWVLIPVLYLNQLLRTFTGLECIHTTGVPFFPQGPLTTEQCMPGGNSLLRDCFSVAAQLYSRVRAIIKTGDSGWGIT